MNKKAIYTAIFGNRDYLPVIKEVPEGWDFICFTNEKIPQKSIDEKIWKIINVKPYSKNASKNSKLYKTMPHIYLWEYNISMWIDANIQIDNNFDSVIMDALINYNLAVYYHPRKDQDAYQEGKRCISLKKDYPYHIEPQLEKYKNEGYPSGFGLFSCNVIMRRHKKPDVSNFDEMWWNEIKQHSKRDQISFSYLVWKTRIRLNILSRDKVFFESGAHLKRV